MDHRSTSKHATTVTGKSNRRRQRRERLSVKADVTLPGDLTIVGHTLDISSGGLSIEVPYMLGMGERCEIELNLSKLGGPKWVQVVGEVRNCNQVDDDSYRVGLQFVDMDAQLKTLLDDCLWSRIAPAGDSSGSSGNGSGSSH